MKDDKNIVNVQSEILIYRNGDGEIKLHVRFENENVWLNQQMMAELFQTTKQNISKHLKSIFEEGELNSNSVVNDLFTTAKDGKSYKVSYYNLDAIISVGYRIKSYTATRFRIWATQKLKEFLIKGFVMDDERLKNPLIGVSHLPDYFDEMLERIRDIRASEKRMYLRVREIFAMADNYVPNDQETQTFFSIIQNKLHYAATGLTAPEIIKTRANHLLPYMGLTSWKEDEPRKSDVNVAKNYLKENEIEELNRIVVMWLDFAEDQARRRKKVFLRDWEQKLDDFLRFNERNVLPDKGSVSRKEAQFYAENEYEQYAVQRRLHKEKVGAVDNIKSLKIAAKMIEKKKKNKKRDQK